MKSVLIVGANGLLGASLQKRLNGQFKIVTVTRHSPESDFQRDMTCTATSLHLLNDLNPDYIVNLAAITNVDFCETNKQLAYLVNNKIAENIALYMQSSPKTFTVQISTDHVYNAAQSAENDVQILNTYALSKYCGEKSFIHQNAVVLRTNFFGKSQSRYAKGFCGTFFEKLRDHVPLTLFDDVYFSPVSINRLCDIIKMCLMQKICGVFNVGSKDGMSKAQFILNFADLLGFTAVKYELVSIDKLQLPTARPKDMRMDVTHFEQAFEYELPSLEHELMSVCDEFKTSIC